MSHKPDYDEIRRLERELGINQPPPEPPPPPPRRHITDEEREIENPPLPFGFTASSTSAVTHPYVAYGGMNLRPTKTKPTIYDHRGRPL